jgi:hypothetical protein
LDEEKSEIPDEDEDRERERIFLEVDALVEDNEPEKKKLSDNPFIIMLTGIMVVVVVMLMTHLLDFQKSVQQLFSICTIAFVAITIIDGMYRKGIISGDDSTPDEEEFERTLYELGRATESRTVRIEIDKEFQDNHDAKLAELKAREEIAVEDRNAYYELKDRYKKLLERFNILETEKNAIDMAIGKIKGISSEISANLSTSLIANISENICAITEGRINGVSLDEENHLSVIINDRAAALEALDTDSLKKLYLAVRLSVAQLLKTERLPLVMDVNLKAYQLTTLLNCLSKIDTDQIILLTDVDMRKSIDEMSINYEYVEL